MLHISVCLRTASNESKNFLFFLDIVDHSSNIKVSTIKNGATARRDSWDVINKTKHLLSHNSLESLANMTESQLNTDLSYNRPQELDNETERNTRYNKFSLAEKQRLEARRSSEEAAKYRLLSYVFRKGFNENFDFT